MPTDGAASRNHSRASSRTCGCSASPRPRRSKPSWGLRTGSVDSRNFSCGARSSCSACSSLRRPLSSSGAAGTSSGAGTAGFAGVVSGSSREKPSSLSWAWACRRHSQASRGQQPTPTARHMESPQVGAVRGVVPEPDLGRECKELPSPISKRSPSQRSPFTTSPSLLNGLPPPCPPGSGPAPGRERCALTPAAASSRQW